MESHLEKAKEQHNVWKQNPEFKHSTASELLYFHSHFRDSAVEIWKLASQLDQEDTEDKKARITKKIEQKFTALNQFLHTHHSLEEGFLFPKMQQRFGVEIHDLNGQHDEMRTREAKVNSLLKCRPVSDQDLKEELRGFLELLLLHLNEEEEKVVPHLMKVRDVHAL